MKFASFAVLLLASTASSVSVGDRLVRTYTRYVEQPITIPSAVEGGWAPMSGGSCDARYGIPYVNATTGLERHSPTILYFSPNGEMSGVSVELYGAAPPQKLIDMRFFDMVNPTQYRLGLSFRANPCGAVNATNLPMGDRIVVAPGGANHVLPLTKDAAVAQNWFAGSCFEGMGTHYFYDVATAPVMSWEAENVFPVVTMFNNNGDIQAIFFASWTTQEQLGNTNNWEPIPLPNLLMCKNTCDSMCTFKGTSFWSTYHMYFKDLELATCPNNCTIACCEQ